ncbi:DUF2330 domain-containing protein [Alkalinema pantanalense CENA528]|uniref:DUF2330 domain-containing protein n=1 Tax=Alkalinema pantanalense TaxID=1620705 RepID=UPI003D6E93EA
MCGAFFARITADLTNTASRVVIAREGNKTVFTMANNFQGNVKEFARIVPMPVLPRREQVRIGDNLLLEQLDRFTAPRLASSTFYFNKAWEAESLGYIPVALGLLGFCIVAQGIGWVRYSRFSWPFGLAALFLIAFLIAVIVPASVNQASKGTNSAKTSAPLEIADQFSIGEYNVTLLSAAESDALTDWLKKQGYQLPQGGEPMLKSYIQAGMKFFVVNINLEKVQRTESGFLRPIVVEYESPQLMLPIRLSTLNARSDQDLIVYVLSPDQMAEVANYPNQTMPTDGVSVRGEISGREIPTWINYYFEEFYQAVFQKAYEQAGKNAAFLEYAGKIASDACKPCTMDWEQVDSLVKNLPKLGVSWSGTQTRSQTYVTRLHVRYNATTFPRDLEFRMLPVEALRSRLEAAGTQVTAQPDLLFQIRFANLHATGTPFGFSALRYWLNDRKTEENLVNLTGWSRSEIQQKRQSINPNS